MGQTIQFRRGNEMNLPELLPGEPAVALDTKKIFVGSPSGNIELPSPAKLEELNTQLAQIANPKKIDLSTYKNTIADISDYITQKIDEGYNWFIIPKRTRLNKTLRIHNKFNIVFEGTGGFEPEFELNTGGIGVKIEGSSFIFFKKFTMATRVVSSHFEPLNLDNPSTIGLMYTRSAEEDSCQWNNSENLTIYMHTDNAANSGRGTIGLYNCTAESQSYNNLTVYGDVPLVVTRTDIFNLAIKRSPSMKALHFAGATTLIATGGHALVTEGFSDLTFDNLYMAKDIYYGSNNEEYAVLITGVEAQGYENYNLNILNYDCEEFKHAFLVQARLRHSKVFGNQHNAIEKIVSVETANGILDSCEFDIQTTSSEAVVDLVYTDTLCAGVYNSRFNMYKSSYRLTCNKPFLGCTVYSNGKPNIVNNHGAIQTIHVLSEVGLGINNNYINFSYAKPTPTDGTPFSRGMFPGNFAFNMNTQVGSPAGWICNGSDYFEVGQVGYRSFDHDPTGTETPLRVGEEVFNWMGPKWYKSVGLGSSDWRAMTV